MSFRNEPPAIQFLILFVSVAVFFFGVYLIVLLYVESSSTEADGQAPNYLFEIVQANVLLFPSGDRGARGDILRNQFDDSCVIKTHSMNGQPAFIPIICPDQTPISW